jgi:hypothetical protein
LERPFFLEGTIRPEEKSGGFTLTLASDLFLLLSFRYSFVVLAEIPKMDRHRHFSPIFMGFSSHLHISSLISYWQRLVSLQAHERKKSSEALLYQERKVNP